MRGLSSVEQAAEALIDRDAEWEAAQARNTRRVVELLGAIAATNRCSAAAREAAEHLSDRR